MLQYSRDDFIPYSVERYELLRGPGMAVIVDYGIGNLGSIQNMIRKVGGTASIGSTRESIEKAEILILPGVGSFDSGISQLKLSGLWDILNQRVLDDRIPVLGICLGAQLMTRSSEEGTEKGLGWFDAHTLKMNFSGIGGKWPLPNVGWRNVEPQNGYTMLNGIGEAPRFYFVHSYYLHTTDPEIVSMTTRYGFDFPCGFRRGNIHCVQFHPEKSHAFGMQFFRNFLKAYA
jgi:glutamine amidotransferase